MANTISHYANMGVKIMRFRVGVGGGQEIERVPVESGVHRKTAVDCDTTMTMV